MISIIITAYKEARTIGRAIDSVLKNKIKNFEILAVCPDKETADVIMRYSKKYKQVRHIKDPGKGKPFALNLVFKKAKGDILVLTDGDVYISKNAIPLMLKKFKPGIGAVAGRPISLNSRKEMLGFWSHLLVDMAHKIREKSSKSGNKIFCSGYLYAFRRNLVKKIPPETLSEDGYISYLVYSKGSRIAYSDNSEVYVKYPSTFRDWIIQKKRSTGGYNQIKMWTGEELRSFRQETLGIFDVLKYPRNLREYFYTSVLIFARAYLWLRIFVDINLRKRKLKKLWLRVESTK